jgi:hypothetical protein
MRQQAQAHASTRAMLHQVLEEQATSTRVECTANARKGNCSSRPSVLGHVVLFGVAGAAFGVASVAFVGSGVASIASSCISRIFRRSGSAAKVTTSAPSAPSVPKATDQLCVVASALSRDGSCSASMAGAAPAPASASAPVRAPASWTWVPVEPIYRPLTHDDVTAGVKASHVAVPKVNPVTGGRFTTTRLRSYADAVNGRKATLIVA